MMFAQERAAIEGRFQGAWNAATYPAQYEGVPFSPPDAAAWVALTILTGDGVRVELGEGGRSRWAGVIIVSIFVPPNGVVDGVNTLSSAKKASDVADLVKAIFHEVQFTTTSGGLITTWQTSVRRVGISGGWLQYNASTPFKREE